MKEFLKRSVRILGTRNFWHFLKGYYTTYMYTYIFATRNLMSSQLSLTSMQLLFSLDWEKGYKYSFH
jgi:hypothetical protein